MPIYEYQCRICQHYFTSKQTIDDRLVPETEPCPECGRQDVQKILTGAPGLGDSVRLGLRKPDEGFKDVLRKIHDSTPGSVLKNNSSHI